MMSDRNAVLSRHLLLRRRFLIALFAAHLGVQVLAHAEPKASEYAVKAAFLFHLGAFVEWPAATEEPATVRPLVIGIVGEDPFGRELDDTVRSERIQERPFEVVRFARAQEIGACQILFVAGSEAPRLTFILRAVHGRPILSVSDIERFAARGGMVGMNTRSGRVRLEVNLAAARASGLGISSKLLRLAQPVET